MNRDNIPPELTEMEQWQPMKGEKHAHTGWNKPENWKCLDDIPENQEAIFNMSTTNILMIDGDQVCFSEKRLYPEAHSIIKRITKGRRTYAEWSQSKMGIHIAYDMTDYADEFESMTGKGKYNILLKCAADAHIEFYFKTAHLFRFTGDKVSNSADRVSGGEDAAEAARVITELIKENTPAVSQGNGISHDWHVDENGLVPVGERHHYVVSRCGEMVDRIGDHADPDAILALIEADFLQHCADPGNIDGGMDAFRKKYKRTIEKYLEARKAEKEDPNFYSYALKAWKEEHPGEQFDPDVTPWKDVSEAGKKAKAAGREFTAAVATVKDGKTVPVKKVPEVKLVSAKELYRSKLPEIYYPIDGLVPEGETILAAPPKSAKSWMALDMALSVAEGKPFLGFDTNKSDVVYFSLEDGDKFEQERLYKYCKNENDVPEGFHLIFEDWVTLDDGFIDQLEQIREKLPDLRFVIIDTLSKIQSRQRKNESAYERDYRTGQMIKRWADQYGIAVVVITHTTKLVRPDDALANVSGTNGVTGVADAVLVIAKEKRTDTEAVLAIDGRRVRQAEHEIRIDWDSCRWQYVGLADPDERERRQREKEIEKVKSSTAYKAILVVADKNPNGWEGGARKLVNDAIGYGVLVTETPKDVGGMLTNSISLLAQDGVRVQVIKNGSGANSYKLSAWHKPQEEGAKAPFDPESGVAEYIQE